MDNIISLKYFRGKENEKEINLIKKAKKGDAESFTKLIKIHKEYLYKTAYVYVKNEDKALDILQETTYKAFINIKKLRDLKYFKTWITRILINISLNIIKKEENVVYLEDDNPLISNEIGTTIEEKLDLYNAIELLKDKYKTVIILKYFNDMKIKDIAYVMNIPENTVKSYLKRAKNSLIKILKEGYLDE